LRSGIPFGVYVQRSRRHPTMADLPPPILFCTHFFLNMKAPVRKHHQLCQEPGCSTRSSFGFEGGKPERCAKHKDSKMIGLWGNRCATPGCMIHPKFGFEGEGRTLCKQHKMEGMINVSAKRCDVVGCSTQSSFGPPGEDPAFCKRHKQTDMVNVISKKCSHPDCDTSAKFGRPGFSPTTCAKHKDPGTIFNPNKRCKEPSCSSHALYGSTIARHCSRHRVEGEENLVYQRCPMCGLVDLLHPTLGVCDTCDPSAFMKYRRGRKERVVLRLFEGLGYDFVHDTRNPGGCLATRPDFRFEATSGIIVIVEVDEEQHTARGYTPECELARMKNMVHASWTPHVFIRYNPDAYTTNGIKFNPPISERHRVLCKTLDTCLELPYDSIMLRETRLFYDGYTPRNDTLNVLEI